MSKILNAVEAFYEGRCDFAALEKQIKDQALSQQERAAFEQAKVLYEKLNAAFDAIPKGNATPLKASLRNEPAPENAPSSFEVEPEITRALTDVPVPREGAKNLIARLREEPVPSGVDNILDEGCAQEQPIKKSSTNVIKLSKDFFKKTGDQRDVIAASDEVEPDDQ